MSGLNAYLAEHGVMLLSGVTALLVTGVFGTAIVRSPLHRQRICELTVLATVMWIVLACVPLPRFDLHANRTASASAADDAGSKVELTVADIPVELIAKPQAAIQDSVKIAVHAPRASANIDWRTGI